MAHAEHQIATLSPQRIRLRLTYVFAAVALFVSLSVAVSVGAVSVPLPTVWGIVANKLSAGLINPDWSAGREAIVWDIRLPRAILACLVGAGLCVRCWSRNFFDLPRCGSGLEVNGVDAPWLLCLLPALLLEEAKQVKRTAYDNCYCGDCCDSRFLYKSCPVSFWYYFSHCISSRSNPPGGLPGVSGRHLPGFCW